MFLYHLPTATDIELRFSADHALHNNKRKTTEPFVSQVTKG